MLGVDEPIAYGIRIERLFRDRVRLAGERGLVGAQRVSRDHDAVGGKRFAGADHREVANHAVRRGHVLLGAIAHDPGTIRDQILERLRRRVRAAV